jgi:putative copper export protein
VDEALVIARLIHFAAAMAGFGSAAFRLYAVDGESARETAAALQAFDRWLARVMQASALVMLVSGLAMVPVIAARMAGTGTAAFDASTIAAVLFQTGFGPVWCWHLVFAALLTVSASAAAHRHALTLTWTALALGSLGWVGHAAGTGGVDRPRPGAQSIGASARRRLVARRIAAAGPFARPGAPG